MNRLDREFKLLIKSDQIQNGESSFSTSQSAPNYRQEVSTFKCGLLFARLCDILAAFDIALLDTSCIKKKIAAVCCAEVQPSLQLLRWRIIFLNCINFLRCAVCHMGNVKCKLFAILLEDY